MSVVIVGAAGGIGSAVVNKFLSNGVPVLGADIVDSPLSDVDYKHFVGDLRDDEVLGRLVSNVPEVQHLIIIAGGALPAEAESSDFSELGSEAIAGSVELNLTLPMRVVGAFLPLLRENVGTDSSVSLTGSVNGSQGIGIPAYSAAKAGLESFSQNIAVSEGGYGVRSNVVAPGTVVTPHTEDIWRGVPGHFDSLLATTALGRLTSVDDIADAFWFLSQSRAVTGQVLTVDSGQIVKGFRS